MSGKLAVNGGSKVRAKPFPGWPVFGEPEEKALLRALRSGTWGLSVEAAEFENTFARYHDCEHGITVVNGTVSLRLALIAAGIREGDEAIVPPYTFLATASAAIEANATPVFVDIEPDTYNIDPRLVEQAVTPRTRAIVPVHFGGLPADMDAIMAIAKKHGLAVIEDCAHAHGSIRKGSKVGSIGDMGSFSFQSSKNLTAGEGGIIITNSAELADMCRSLRNCGRVQGGEWYHHRNPGGNYRMSEFHAALLSAQFTRLEEQAATRDANGLFLDAELGKIPGIRPMKKGRPPAERNAYHLYVFRYNEKEFGGVPRSGFIRAMNAEGIPVSGGYPIPLYRQPMFLEKVFGPFTGCLKARPELDYSRVSCPACEAACEREACWLMQSVLLENREGMRDIVDAAAKVYENRNELNPQ